MRNHDGPETGFTLVLSGELNGRNAMKCDPASIWTRRSFLKLGAAATALLSVPPSLRARSSGAPVSIACSNRLGSAAQIGDFLGAGGELDAVAANRRDPVNRAWRRLGMRYVGFEDISAEGLPWQRLKVTRGGDGTLAVDFTDWDRNMRNFMNGLGSTPIIYLGAVPRTLSSQPERDDYSIFMPRSLEEWERFCTMIVRHNVDALGLPALQYGGTCGEPDYRGNYLYNPDDDPSTQLRNSVELYASSYRGVKAADPSARVGAPGTMNWQITKYTEAAVFSLEDWLRDLAAYNAEVGDERAAGLDFLYTQDYAWSSDRLSDGADAMRRILGENGFDPETPIGFAGGAGWGNWCSDYLDTGLRPHMRASHIISNVAHEFNDPAQRRFLGRALYYTFYYRDEWRAPGDPNDDPYTEPVALVTVSRRGRVRLTAMYAAFEIVSALTSGEIVEATAAEPIAILAVRDDARRCVRAVANNHTGEEAAVDVTVYDLPFTGRARRLVQRVDTSNSNNNRGLQRGARDRLSVSGGAVNFTFSLPAYASALVTLTQG